MVEDFPIDPNGTKPGALQVPVVGTAIFPVTYEPKYGNLSQAKIVAATGVLFALPGVWMGYQAMTSFRKFGLCEIAGLASFVLIVTVLIEPRLCLLERR